MGYKRIIDGKTYNTDTSSRVYEWESLSGDRYEALYQTRHGAFYVWWYDQAYEAGDIKPLDDEAALAGLENYPDSADAIERFFGKFPEAGAAEKRITIRLPGNLYSRLADPAP